MKLNSDIIKDFLTENYPVRQYGKGSDKMTLERPVFYVGEKGSFESDHVYLVLADQLPRNPVFSDNVVLICIGKPPSVYMSGICVCLEISENQNLFHVFNKLQEIYDIFDRWETGLQEILRTTSNIQSMIDISEPVLNNPMVVIDADYVIQGYSKVIDEREEFAVLRPDKNHFIRQELLIQNVWKSETDMSLTKPFLIEFEGNISFSENLFDQGNYVGNLSVRFMIRPFRKSDSIISQYLSARITEALIQNRTLSYGGKELIRNIFQVLLKGYPLTGQSRQYVENVLKFKTFQCIRAVLEERSRRKLPVSYFCYMIEKSFPQSIAFEYENSILILTVVSENHPEQRAGNSMWELLSSMALTAGVSVLFMGTELAKLRFYYHQTSVAMNLGRQEDPGKNIYFFEDYALYHMIYSCIGEFPKELLFPAGFSRLLAYDAMTQTDYIGTLKVYLDTNMNVAKSAEKLYIHRSTFLERLKKIEKFLGMSLKEPDMRLQINILLKILELEKKHQQDSGKDIPKAAFLKRDAKTQYKELEGLL